MSTELQLVAGTLSTNCWTNPQALINEAFQKGAALLGDITGILIQDTTPDPNDRDKAWIKLTAPGGAPSNSLPFVWFNGAWVARHPIAPGSGERRIFVGTTTDLNTYDGGSAGSVNDTTGPMWEVDSTFAFRMPLGVGTSPDGTSVAVNGTGGSEFVELEEENIPEHVHNIQGHLSTSGNTDTDPASVIIDDDYLSTETAQDTEPWGGDAAGDTEPHQNMPPFIGVYFIKRTNRIYFTP